MTHFWFHIQPFLLFFQIFQLDIFEGVNFRYNNTPLKFKLQNNKISHFCSQIKAFQFFPQILQIDKFQGADLKYDNSIFNILPQKYTNKAHLAKNTQIGHFWSQIFAFLFFLQTFPLGKFEGVDFKYSDIVLKWLPKYTKMRHS